MAALDCDRWNWRELVASEHSGLPPVTRLVLLTLSLHMTEHGDNAWPSQTSLAKRTGLSERGVREHLAIAKSHQWVRVEKRQRPGKAWYLNQYFPTVPDKLADQIKTAPWEEDPKWQRQAPRSGRKGSRPANGAQRPANDDTTTGTTFHNDRHHVPTNSSSNSPRNKSYERLPTNTDDDDFFLNGGREPERRPKLFPDQEPEPEVQQQQKPTITDAQLWQTLNNIGPEYEYRVGAMTKILAARYLDVTEERLWRVIRAEQAALQQRQHP